VQTPHEQPFKKLQVKLLRDDEVLQQMDVPVLRDGANYVPCDGPANFDVLGIILTLQGMRFEKSAILRVRVETESEELSATGFRVVLKSEELELPE
jgi:hypothetical protein